MALPGEAVPKKKKSQRKRGDPIKVRGGPGEVFEK